MAVLAMMATFAADSRAADDSCQAGPFSVSLVSVSEVACSLGICTRFEYAAVPDASINAAHAALAFDAFFDNGDEIRLDDAGECTSSGNCTPSAFTYAGPGELESQTQLGGEETIQVVRFNADPGTVRFFLDIQGRVAPAPATAGVQASGKGDKISTCLLNGPAAIQGNPELATTTDTCFERNGCTACFTPGPDGLVYDADSSNIGGPGCPQGGLLTAPAVQLNIPGENGGIPLKAQTNAVGEIGGTFGEGSCPFLYTKSDGSIGGFCDCFGVFDTSIGRYVQRDPLSICGPPTGCCTSGATCGFSPIRDTSRGLDGPLCPN